MIALSIVIYPYLWFTYIAIILFLEYASEGSKIFKSIKDSFKLKFKFFFLGGGGIGFRQHSVVLRDYA